MLCFGTLLVLVIIELPKLGYTFWPASFRVDLKDEKSFVISGSEEEEEGEDEMIKPEDLADIAASLADDEERYKALHSHVEHYNRRAAPPSLSESVLLLNFQAKSSLTEKNSIPDEPFVAGFKHQLDKVFKQDLLSNRSKRQDSGELVERIILRNNSIPEGEFAGHATPHPSDSDNRPSAVDDYEGQLDISFDHSTTEENKESWSASNLDSQQSYQQAEEEQFYDYEEFRLEYEEQIKYAKSNNMSFDYRENGEPEETVGEAINKIVKFDMPKNCTNQELTQLGVKPLECLDYKNSTINYRIIARSWTVVRVWICIYLCIAVPCWCQKGWCCCCFRCRACFPEVIIFEAKDYYAKNGPGILVHRPTEPIIKYKPTLFELDAYESLESAIRNL